MEQLLNKINISPAYLLRSLLTEKIPLRCTVSDTGVLVEVTNKILHEPGLRPMPEQTRPVFSTNRFGFPAVDLVRYYKCSRFTFDKIQAEYGWKFKIEVL